MKHVFTKDECSRGGKNGTREDKQKAGRAGFERVSETHPYFVRKHLKRIIKDFNGRVK